MPAHSFIWLASGPGDARRQASSFTRSAVLFSKTREYALQALVLLATTPDEDRLNREVAAHLEAPGPYLAKVLKRFAQHGYLESAKRRGGGRRTRPRALEASVLEIVAAADGNDPVSGCPPGLSRCTDHVACPNHQRRVAPCTRLGTLPERQTVGNLAVKSHAGRSRLSAARKTLPRVTR